MKASTLFSKQFESIASRPAIRDSLTTEKALHSLLNQEHKALLVFRWHYNIQLLHSAFSIDTQLPFSYTYIT